MVKFRYRNLNIDSNFNGEQSLLQKYFFLNFYKCNKKLPQCNRLLVNVNIQGNKTWFNQYHSSYECKGQELQGKRGFLVKVLTQRILQSYPNIELSVRGDSNRRIQIIIKHRSTKQVYNKHTRFNEFQCGQDNNNNIYFCFEENLLIDNNFIDQK